MKNVLKRSIFALLPLFIVFSGCKKDYLKEEDVFPQDGFIKGKVIGTRESDNQPFEINFNYTSVLGLAGDAAISTDGNYSFLEQHTWYRYESGSNVNVNNMAMRLRFKNATDLSPSIDFMHGRFSSSTNNKVFIYEFELDYNDPAITLSQLTIDSDNNRVKGNFAISLPTGNDDAEGNNNAATITGSFDLPFNKQVR